MVGGFLNCCVVLPLLFSFFHVVMDVASCNNMCTSWDKITEAASKEGKDLDFCGTIDACQALYLTPLMIYPQFTDLGQDELTKKWSWERIIDVSSIQQSERSEAYVVKAINFLLTDTPLVQLNDKRMELFKEKYLVYIFRGRMDPS
ncbi:uncharacterized protein [Nicotiana sylvestris]|uniref:Uncharacterized protein LOC104234209 n=1 Tax=Nicotiana sylvestris TaxID=4096 RepID=A0A1U7X1M2_NICSY|nr:PREDICTED: uncharacterized protein LOC104234209 [Nicotiana sylvestris]